LRTGVHGSDQEIEKEEGEAALPVTGLYRRIGMIKLPVRAVTHAGVGFRT
jgi:hypothetical protein